MMKEKINEVFVLLRFFEKEDYLQTFRTGRIRMMSADHYKNFEKCSGKLYNNRHDMLENSVFVYNPQPNGTVQLKEPLTIGNSTYNTMWCAPSVVSPIMIANDNYDKLTKLSCFYSIFRNGIVDGKISSYLSTMKSDLGEYYCLIVNTPEFITRIINGFTKYQELRIAGNGQLGFIKYVNEHEYNDRYGAFCKPSGLSWQKEFRVKIETDNIDPFYFEVECLKDITIWGKTSDLYKSEINDKGDIIINNYFK